MFEPDLEPVTPSSRTRWRRAWADGFARISDRAQESMDRFTDAVLEQPRRIWLVVLICMLPMVTLVLIELPARAHVVLSCVLVAAGLTVARRAPNWRLIVVFLSLVASFRYMLFRGTETLSLHTTGDTVVSCLLLSLIHI